MPNREIELALKRGRLQERIAAQRATLAAQMGPIANILGAADRTIALGKSGIAYARTHPVTVGAAVALLAALRPKRVWRWSRRVFLAWTAWRKLRIRLEGLGLVRGTGRSAHHQ
jgi:hypothetical protein